MLLHIVVGKFLKPTIIVELLSDSINDVYVMN